ncbi:MAG: hypothetical protein DME89_03815 [Verrucomicrobia bacterium]|nr:MAG: hypothetical protein DME89_03815 [Verrucomicrobiota bacterium]
MNSETCSGEWSVNMACNFAYWVVAGLVTSPMMKTMFGFFAYAKELVPETAKATMTSPIIATLIFISLSWFVICG